MKKNRKGREVVFVCCQREVLCLMTISVTDIEYYSVSVVSVCALPIGDLGQFSRSQLCRKDSNETYFGGWFLFDLLSPNFSATGMHTGVII